MGNNNNLTENSKDNKTKIFKKSTFMGMLAVSFVGLFLAGLLDMFTDFNFFALIFMILLTTPAILILFTRNMLIYKFAKFFIYIELIIILLGLTFFLILGSGRQW